MSESNNLPQSISHKKLSYLMLNAQKDVSFSDDLENIYDSEKREFNELISNWEKGEKGENGEKGGNWGNGEIAQMLNAA